MYARVITLQLQPGKLDEVMRLTQDSILPLLKRQGIKGGYLVGDRNTGKAVFIGLWESEADATAVDTSGLYQQLVASLGQYLAGPPVREQYEGSMASGRTAVIRVRAAPLVPAAPSYMEDAPALRHPRPP